MRNIPWIWTDGGPTLGKGIVTEESLKLASGSAIVHEERKYLKKYCCIAIQTLNGPLRLNVGRDLYAKPTSAYKERKLSTTAES